jgi:hypothetical protein
MARRPGAITSCASDLELPVRALDTATAGPAAKNNRLFIYASKLTLNG